MIDVVRDQFLIDSSSLLRKTRYVAFPFKAELFSGYLRQFLKSYWKSLRVYNFAPAKAFKFFFLATTACTEFVMFPSFSHMGVLSSFEYHSYSSRSLRSTTQSFSLFGRQKSRLSSEKKPESSTHSFPGKWDERREWKKENLKDFCTQNHSYNIIIIRCLPWTTLGTTKTRTF